MTRDRGIIERRRSTFFNRFRNGLFILYPSGYMIENFAPHVKGLVKIALILAILRGWIILYAMKGIEATNTEKGQERISSIVKIVGIRIREIRTRKGLTQKELAERAGTTQEKVCYYELGTTQPSIVSLEKIATGLDVNLVELLR
ncbi:MAG: helix-turn-helix domain-containing protein [Thermodesulfobacteriota bacterium]